MIITKCGSDPELTRRATQVRHVTLSVLRTARAQLSADCIAEAPHCDHCRARARPISSTWLRCLPVIAIHRAIAEKLWEYDISRSPGAVAPNLTLHRCGRRPEAVGGAPEAGLSQRSQTCAGPQTPGLSPGGSGASLPLAKAYNLPGFPVQLSLPGRSPSGFTSPGAILELARFRGRHAGEGPRRRGLSAPSAGSVGDELVAGAAAMGLLHSDERRSSADPCS